MIILGSVFGNTVIVGADGDDDNGLRSGSAYVFEKDHLTGIWNQTAKLTAPNGAKDDRFGSSVSVFSNSVIISAFGDDNLSGSVYAFEKTPVI